MAASATQGGHKQKFDESIVGDGASWAWMENSWYACVRAVSVLISEQNSQEMLVTFNSSVRISW